MRRWLGWKVIVAATVAVGALAWIVGAGRPRRSTASSVITLYGNVDVRQVELGFRVPGRLASMKLEEGMRVSAGGVMAALDPRSFECEVNAREAELDAQNASLKMLLAGSRPAELSRAQASIREATALREHANNELERAQALLAERAISPATYDRSIASAREADARLLFAKESFRLLAQGSRAEEIETARAMVRVAETRLTAARLALDDARLVAPSDGVVVSRVREPGAIVGPTDVVYVLSLTDEVWVRAYVSEVQLGSIHPGMQVEVLSDSSPERTFKGHVGFISPIAEFTPKTVETTELRTDLVYRLRVIVDDPGVGLRQGMPVTVRIPIAGA